MGKIGVENKIHGHPIMPGHKSPLWRKSFDVMCYDFMDVLELMYCGFPSGNIMAEMLAIV